MENKMYADKYVSQACDLPTGKHYAILVSEGIYIPGDERSRQAPGHGYPAHTQPYLRYEVYETEEKLKQAIQSHIERKSDFKVVSVNPIVFEKKVSIFFDEK
jgi:hypothetical protein